MSKKHSGDPLIQCAICSGESTIKKGKQRKTGKQKYFCKDCNKYFMPEENYTNKAYTLNFGSVKGSPEMSLRELSREIGISVNSIRNYKNTKHIVCYSGGHSSALVAVEVVRRFGKENVILLNHEINQNVEDADIKRFKREVAQYLQLNITYANMKNWHKMDQFDVSVKSSAFKVSQGTELCTSRLKTEPFNKYLKKNFHDKNCIIYYGFDPNETARIQRRAGILGAKGYKSDYPLALWKSRTIQSIEEIGIAKPGTYSVFKHGNCVGCLKAGKQHWYVVYSHRPDIWEKAKWAEDELGYSIINGVYLEELEDEFELMKSLHVEPTELTGHQRFWADVRKLTKGHEIIVTDNDAKPCECVF